MGFITKKNIIKSYQTDHSENIFYVPPFYDGVTGGALRDRVQQWRVAWPCIKNSLNEGEHVLLHCVAGRHRAAAVAVLTRALLASETITESNAWIQAKRDIELHKVAYDRGAGAWLKETHSTASVGAPWPRINGFLATGRSNLIILIIIIIIIQNELSKSRYPQTFKSPFRILRGEKTSQRIHGSIAELATLIEWQIFDGLISPIGSMYGIFTYTTFG